MVNVVIDGKAYAPVETADAPLIGVAVTVRNRHESAKQCIEAIRERLPSGVPLFIVDDASDPVFCEAAHRFDTNVGIAAAKNMCLELLMEHRTANGQELQHFFLFDSDAYPVDDDWWAPYVRSPEPHLMAQFLDLSGGIRLNDMKVLHQDSRHTAYSGARGYMLYLAREAVEKVGGFDLIYTPAMYEHVDLSNRIHNAGLTTWRYADVAENRDSKLIRSLDAELKVDRTIPTGESAELAKAHGAICYRRRDEGYADFVPYRQPRNVVLTCLLTSQVDPQRGVKMQPDPEVLRPLLSSVRGGDAVVIHDELEILTPGESWKVEAQHDPYFQRWLSYHQWLRTSPDVGYVWCVDGTDVEMLREPWADMEPGILYTGYEPKTVGIPWMRDNHKARVVADWMRDNPDLTLLNAGVVGGDREVMLEFTGRMVRLFFDNAIDVFRRTESESLGDVGDMAAFNYVARSFFGDRLRFGPDVVSLFKQDERNEWSWWKHK